MTHNWTIYMYTFPNGKRYVGATSRPLHLRQGSKESGWARYRGCHLLWEAIQQYGVDSIEQTILFKGVIEDSEAAELEKSFIEQYKTNVNRYSNPSYGYNLGDGGEGTSAKHLTEERKRQLSQQMAELGQNNRGKIITETTRKRLSEAKMGKKRSPLSDEVKKRIGHANSLDRITPETRKRKSESHKQPVRVFDPVSEKTMLFNSREETANYFGVQPSAVSRWISGERKPKNGFVFINNESGEEVSV